MKNEIIGVVFTEFPYWQGNMINETYRLRSDDRVKKVENNE